MESTQIQAPVSDVQEHPVDAATVAVASDAPTLVVDERPGDRGLSLLLFAMRTRELSLIDMPLLQESAIDLVEIVRSELKAIRVDPAILSDARAFRIRPDLSLLWAPFARLGSAAGRLLTIRPRVRVSEPTATYPTHVRKVRIKPVVPARSEAPRVPRVRRGLRVRWGRVLTRGLSLGLLAAILIALPTEMIGNVGTMANELSVAIRERLAAATSSAPALQRAGFELPPLSAYGATFESQASYPTAHPNAPVEWVVALRNTGSASWYRGIDGAQASLALADGTTAGVQTTAYVGPGQVGWFVVHFTAASEVGTSRVRLLPRIDGRGALPDLGIYATVTVSPNP